VALPGACTVIVRAKRPQTGLIRLMIKDQVKAAVLLAGWVLAAAPPAGADVRLTVEPQDRFYR
jgi:hypothetical protein